MVLNIFEEYLLIFKIYRTMSNPPRKNSKASIEVCELTNLFYSLECSTFNVHMDVKYGISII